MSAPTLITLGCRLNTFESEVIRAQALEAGLDDAVIVNTCAVTAEAERQARQAIRRARRDNPGAKIIVTGCAAQLHPEAFADMDEVDRVLGNAEKLDATALGGTAAISVSDIMAATETAPHLIEGFDGRTRAFVQVQQGCDHRCTFCIIPFARGNNRSVNPDAVVEQVATLVEQGYGEVVLTGVDISSFGADLPGTATLGGLCRRLLAEVPSLRRLRLSSLDPAAVDEDVMDLLGGEPRLMPHMHLSLQAMDDMVLKRMKRRHSRAQAIDLIERIRAARPDAVFGADLIAGFPTETDAMFQNTLDAVRDLDIAFLHVFPFSARKGTPAAKMPPVDKAVAKARAAELRDAGAAALATFLASRVGSVAEVLVEEGRSGRSEHYAPVELAFDAAPGAIVKARIADVRDSHLVGQEAA
jgi:threonylcarbamoyladenosine tRNA methylthiotransferase MtaB